MRRICRLTWGNEAGVAALEFVIWTPVLLILVGLAVVGGRVAKTDAEIQAAARAAARAASIQRSATDAVAAANQAAQADLTSAGVTCHDFNLELIPSGPGGVDTANLSCVVPLGGVDLIGVGPSKTITTSFSSPVDVYRQYGP
jgi:Flp pilus assembly protein TadG